MNTPKRVHVEIEESSIDRIVNHVHQNLSIFKTLRDRGIPVDGVLELRGVTHGRLMMHNEIRDNGVDRVLIFDWEDDPGVQVVDPKPVDPKLPRFNLDDI